MNTKDDGKIPLVGMIKSLGQFCYICIALEFDWLWGRRNYVIGWPITFSIFIKYVKKVQIHGDHTANKNAPRHKPIKKNESPVIIFSMDGMSLAVNLAKSYNISSLQIHNKYYIIKRKIKMCVW